MAPIPEDPNMAQAWISGTPPDQTIDFYIPRGNTGLMGPQGPIGPSLAVGNIETVTGPAAPGTVGAQGLPGVKGDPGGITTGTLLGTANLNTIITPGMYRTTSGANTTLANNYPVNNNGGVLMVTEMAAGYVIQTYESMTGVSTSSSFMYKRQYANSVWTPWRAFNSTRVDQTAGRAIYQWDDLNSREQLIYGDTGRRIDVPLANGWTGAFILRRVGYEVEAMIYNINGAAATSTSFLTLPSGFKPQQVGNMNWWLTPTVNVSYLVSNNTFARAIGGPALLTDSFYSFKYSTTDSWPTTLPGTANGTIPNL